MKLIFKEFYCPECKQFKWLKLEDICVDCQDRRNLLKISQIRKTNIFLNKEIYIEN